jgi:hypothetical protein
MAGLPHFTNSTAGVKLYEPVYLNQFEVLVTPPASVTLANTRFRGEGILTQQVKSISGLAVDIQPGGVSSQFYKFAERRYAGGAPADTSFALNIQFEVNLNEQNSMIVYKIMRQWADLIYNPLTGAMGIKKDYVGSIVVSIFNKQGDVFRRISLNNCFLTANINPMNLDYNAGENLYTLETSWKADYWQDQFL